MATTHPGLSLILGSREAAERELVRLAASGTTEELEAAVARLSASAILSLVRSPTDGASGPPSESAMPPGEESARPANAS